MKREPKFIILMFSIILGVTISFQLKNKLDVYAPATLVSMQETKAEIEVINSEIEELKKVEKDYEQKLEKLEILSKKNNNAGEVIQSMKKDIEKHKILSGNLTLEGPGIIISLYDNMEDRSEDLGYDINNDVIHDVDILNIINDLRVAGAEAVSINNQRVLSESEVFCNGPSISINKRRTGTPFIIKAIGDPKLLSAAVNAPGTYGDGLKNGLGKGLDTTVEDNLIIESYNKTLSYRYAKPRGEGD